MPWRLLSWFPPFCSSVILRNKMLLLDGLELCPFFSIVSTMGWVVFCSVKSWCSRPHVRGWKGVEFPRQDPLSWMSYTTSVSFGFSYDSAEPGKASTGNPLWSWFLLWTWKESIPRMNRQSRSQIFPAKLPRILEEGLSSLFLGTVLALS